MSACPDSYRDVEGGLYKTKSAQPHNFSINIGTIAALVEPAAFFIPLPSFFNNLPCYIHDGYRYIIKSL